MTSEKITIIFPPPELRNIVDKTATFVARNGPEFASRIQASEANNMKFNFLKVGDPYHAYYQFKVKESIEGIADSQLSNDSHHTTNQQQESNQASQQNGSANLQNGSSTVPAINNAELESQTQALTKKMENLWTAPVILREPPPSFEFSLEPPTLAQYDLDLVKLTAQFVAIHGRNFLTNLMTREQRNYQFDFLRPQHGLFQYFTHLIEQYSKILMPPKSLLGELEKELRDNKISVEKIRYRAEFTKQNEAQKEKEDAEAERERLQYSQIDWHDFAIVETVDFQHDEVGDFALPTTPDQVGSRLLLQQRIEAIDEHDEEPVDIHQEEDEEKVDEPQPEDEFKEPEKPHENPIPMHPPSLDSVVIKRDYDPKAKAAAASAKGLPENWVISPITGERIPAEKVQEHMRYSLLDPKWLETRERNLQDKSRKQDVFAPGSSIESSLKNLAERRTDIFGSGVEETHIGMKIGEDKEIRKPDSTIWDGHVGTKDSVAKAARANISIQEQIQQIHKAKGLLADPDKEKIGPSVPGPPMPVQAPLLTPMKGLTPMSHLPLPVPAPVPVPPLQHHLPMPHPGQPLLTGGIPLIPNPMIRPHDPFGHMQAHPLGVPMGMYGMPPPPPIQPPPPISRLVPDISRDIPNTGVGDSFEPPNKRVRTEDNLIPEDEFLSENSPNVSIKVQIPSSGDKPEWNLNGQTIELSMSYTDSFSTLKTRITDATNMPQNKQKLQFEGIYVKDSNSLAFYNVPQNGIIVLGFKERGGRKK